MLGLAEMSILCVLGMGFLLPFIFVLASFRVVPQDKRLAVYRLGRYNGDMGPGLVLLIPFLDRGVLKDVVPDLPYQGDLREKLVLVKEGGKALSRIFKDGGLVLLDNGEKVDAISEMPIAEGKSVRVRRILFEVEEAG
jgi:regulator of protease activity HflC (stomatin/prohibitin superfamily)